MEIRGQSIVISCILALLNLAPSLIEPAIAGIYRYSVESTTDKFTGHTYHRMDGNRLNGEPFLGRIDFDVQKFVPKDAEPSYQVFIHYRGIEWMFIDEDAPLMLLLDGKRLTFEAPGQVKRETISSGVYESAMYEVELEQLKQIVSAKSVEIRITGKYHADVNFSDKNFERLRSFLATYGEPESPQKSNAEERPQTQQ